MKTWTEYIGVSEPNDNLSLPINKAQYDAIKLDAREELLQEIENLKASTLHSHGPNCQREAIGHITLADGVRHDAPAGFLVFAYQDIDHDYLLFGDERAAKTYAMEQEEKSQSEEGAWPVYALWASDWPVRSVQPPNMEDALAETLRAALQELRKYNREFCQGDWNDVLRRYDAKTP